MSELEHQTGERNGLGEFEQAKLMAAWFLDFSYGRIDLPETLPESSMSRIARHFGEYQAVGLEIIRDELLTLHPDIQLDVAIYICGFPEDNVRHQLKGTFADVRALLDERFPPLEGQADQEHPFKVPEQQIPNSLRHLFPLITLFDAEWLPETACRRTKDPELFFPSLDGDPSAALAICSLCTVREKCLKFALKRNEVYGVWGGMDANERREFRKELIAEGRLEAFTTIED